MSAIKVRAAIETAILNMVPPLQTSWENVVFQSTTNVPYQKVEWMFAPPDNSTLGMGFYREQGYVQVTLMYPIGKGAGDANTRAQLLRDTFLRGSVFIKDGVKTFIVKTPEISNGMVDGDRFALPVRIRFIADVFS
ncbi:phage tail terminator-like protein [Undibacterium sp. TJN19]|uniref:phage tail terminator-like protein n=1 Tax=Undibacterium sp. TJN19 TaxID=3413055 RepID=UPI003BEFC321